MRYPHKTATITALLGCALATPTFAASQSARPVAAALFSYNYLQLSYADLDSGFNGLKLDGSFDIKPDLALTASYLSTSKSDALDYDLFTVGLAYHQRLAALPKSDVVLHGEFEHGSRDYLRSYYRYSNDDSGLRLGAMLRYQVQNNIEAFGDLTYSSLYSNDLALTAGVRLALNQQFSVVGSIELSDDDMLLLGFRMQLK